MFSLSKFCRYGSSFLGNYSSSILGRPSTIASGQVCSYAKTAEEKLGIEKPKRPLTPYFKFMSQMRPALLAKNPDISTIEATKQTSKHWHQLDAEVKTKIFKEYEKDMEDYKKIKEIYEASLTDAQKMEIKKLKSDMAAAKEKRKSKAELKELGRPKRPMSSYFLYCQTKKDLLKKSTNLQDFHNITKQEWAALSPADKAKFEKEAQVLRDKYNKDIQAWEEKMISLGRTELVRTKKLRSKKSSTLSSTEEKPSTPVKEPKSGQK